MTNSRTPQAYSRAYRAVPHARQGHAAGQTNLNASLFGELRCSRLFLPKHICWMGGFASACLCSQCKRSTTARSARGTFRAAQQTQHPYHARIGKLAVQKIPNCREITNKSDTDSRSAGLRGFATWLGRLLARAGSDTAQLRVWDSQCRGEHPSSAHAAAQNYKNHADRNRDNSAC